MKAAVVVIVGVQYVAAILIELVTGFHYRPNFLSFLGAATLMAIFTVCGIELGRRTLIQRSDPGNLIRDYPTIVIRSDVPLVYLAIAAQLCVLAWLKALMPYTVGFRSDELLADLDALIFTIDPWRLLTWLPANLIDRSYLTWVASSITLAALLPHVPKSPKRDRALISFFLVYASASLGQYLLPSAGPIFFERIGLGDRFKDLPVQPWVQITSDYLWANYLSKGAKLGVGISAFPSLHVAGAAWVAIVVSSFIRKLAPVVWAYFALILLGSVYLGWHYAIDGIAGLLIAIAIWRLVAWRQHSAPKIELALQPSD